MPKDRIEGSAWYDMVSITRMIPVCRSVNVTVVESVYAVPGQIETSSQSVDCPMPRYMGDGRGPPGAKPARNSR